MLATMRNRWQGKLVLEGLATAEDGGVDLGGRVDQRRDDAGRVGRAI